MRGCEDPTVDDTALPRDGDVWPIALSRFNREKADDPGGWAWSPRGVWDAPPPAPC